MKSLLFFSATCLLLFYGVGPFCLRETDGFSLARIHSDLAFDPAWEVPALSEEEEKHVKIALSQPYSYLACGGQCFAFASEDGRYVLKFFKHRMRKPFSYFYALSLPRSFDWIRLKKLQKIRHKTQRDFCSYSLAFRELKEESGLLCVRLNKALPFHQKLKIRDKLGISHLLDLNDVEFVLQERATLAYAHIEQLVEKHQETHAQQAIGAIVDLLVARCQKGIFDEDPKIHRNLGFIGNRPIFVDVGRFIEDARRKEPAIYREDVQGIVKSLRYFLEENHPTLLPLLEEEMKRLHV